MPSLLPFTKRIAKKAGKLILEKSQKSLSVSEKAANDFVTNADKASEKLIIKEIKARFPTHAILAEESAASKKQDYFSAPYIWIIDPLDGTLNFIHGFPVYCVSIGVFKTDAVKSSKSFDYLSGELVAGAIYIPRTNELFSAEKGKGAYLNNKKIKVSKTAKVAQALTATGYPPIRKERNVPHTLLMLEKSRGVRRLGAAAVDLCYVAAGRLDAFWEFGLHPWDIAAGSLIITEAGGRVTDTNNQPVDLFGGDILVTNGKIHKEMVEKFSKL